MRWLKLLIGLVVGLLFGWITARFFLDRRQAVSEEAVFELRTTPHEQPSATPAEDVTDATDVAPQAVQMVEQEPVDRGETDVNISVEPDDLRKIEGVGPMISDILNENGIYTFAQLAGTDVDDLRAILTHAGPRFRLANPTTWPQQAQLAAVGDWDGLLALQASLKHGR